MDIFGEQLIRATSFMSLLTEEKEEGIDTTSGCLAAGEKCDGEGVGCESCKSGTPCCSGEYTGCGAFQTPQCK